MENIKYFESQVFNEEESISHSEALNRDWYVACYYTDNRPNFAEIIGRGKVDRVVYYDRKWKDEALLKKHLSRYENCPFEIVTPLKKIDDTYVRETYFCGSDGGLRAITEEHFNFQNDLITEVRMDSHRNIYGTIEYEYDESSGDLSVVRERSANGTVISEVQYDD